MFKAAVKRKNCEQPVLHQGDELAVHRGRQRHKANIHTPVRQPLLHVVIVAVEKTKIHARVVALKLFEDRGKPVDGNGSEGTDAHRTRLQSADGRRRLPELFCRAQKAAHRGQQALALVGEHNAGTAAAENCKTEFALKRVKAVADSRLRAAELLRRPGETACLHHGHERRISVQRHPSTSLNENIS